MIFSDTQGFPIKGDFFPGGGGGGNFPYILLNEIQTMFSQLAEQSSRQ